MQRLKDSLLKLLFARLRVPWKKKPKSSSFMHFSYIMLPDPNGSYVGFKNVELEDDDQNDADKVEFFYHE